VIWVRVLPASTPDVATATGARLCVAELFPSWPLLSRPQQYAAPVLSRAHVWLEPATIWVRVLPERTPDVVTATGALLLIVEPFPSWPLLLLPQQYALPAWIMHEWALPAAIKVACDDAANAGRGDITWTAMQALATSVSVTMATAPRRGLTGSSARHVLLPANLVLHFPVISLP
jgi:hypothetical protein